MFNEETHYCYRNSSGSSGFNEYNASKCYEEATSQEQGYVDCVVDGVILQILAIVGIWGNLFGIWYFWKNHNQTYYAVMCALAISDLITITSFLVYYSIPIAYYTNNVAECSICVYSQYMAYPMLYFSQLTGIYLTIALGLERYNAICKPLAYRLRNTSAYTYIVPVFFVAFIFNLPVFFEKTVRSKTMEKWRSNGTHMMQIGNTTLTLIEPTSLEENAIYIQAYHSVFKVILKCIIPYICLIFLNVSIVRKIYSVRYSIVNDSLNEETIHNRQNDRKGLTAVMSSPGDSVELKVHASIKEHYIRKSQVSLATVNLAIAIIFLLSYSLIWVWAIYDFVQYLSPNPQT